MRVGHIARTFLGLKLASRWVAPLQYLPLHPQGVGRFPLTFLLLTLVLVPNGRL